ncbi:hypothetical protein ABZ922_42190 [Streptomyces shenzhenensis]|uniref:hypothetical protein n=1 Tax=Streptomyces shenzhenensis TaxID=943815 RepID=UPI0033F00759
MTFVSYALFQAPIVLAEQLAADRRPPAPHVTTASPPWPAMPVVERNLDAQLLAELRAVEFAQRVGRGMERTHLTEEFRVQVATARGDRTQHSRLTPTADSDKGLWLAVDQLPCLWRARRSPPWPPHTAAVGSATYCSLCAPPGCMR